MAILDTLKKIKRDLNFKPHPLSEVESVIREKYLLGVGVLALADEAKMNPKEMEAYEALHHGLKMPEGSCQKRIQELPTVGEEEIKGLVDVFRHSPFKYMLILDLYIMANVDGEVGEKEFEFIQLLGDLMEVTHTEEILLGQFADAIQQGNVRAAKSLLDKGKDTQFQLTPEEFLHFFHVQAPPEEQKTLSLPEIYVRRLFDCAGLRTFAFSKDGTVLAYPVGNSIVLWSITEGKITGKLDGHTMGVNSIAFSPFGRHLVSASADGEVVLWDLAINAEIGRLRGHSSAVNSVVFSQDGRQVATGSNDKSVRVWDVENRKEAHCFVNHEGPVTMVAFSPDGNLLGSGSVDNNVNVWKLKAGNERRRLEGHSKNVSAIAFSYDGKLLASGGNDAVLRLWDMEKMLPTREVPHPEIIRGLSFSPDGKLLATGGSEGKIYLWDSRTLNKLYEFYCLISKSTSGEVKSHPVMYLGFSTNSKILGAASTDKITLWKVAWA